MNSTSVSFAILTAAAALLFSFLFAFGIIEGHLVLIVVLWVLLAYLLGRRARTDREPWLPALMTMAALAKLLASRARLYVLVELYDRSGDAGLYHRWGSEIATIWRAMQIPDVTTVARGGEGTRFTAWVTGLVYAPYEPSMLGGFWLFALLAFLGQFFLYLAFRTVVSTEAPLKRYAILIFFWPTVVYWPSSIGKEALIMFFLGLASLAAARMYQRYHLRWIPVIAGSVFVIGMIRIHVAGLLAGSIFVGVLLARAARGGVVASRRAFAVLIGIVLLIPIVTGVREKFDLDVASSIGVHDLEPAFAYVEDRTRTGGSAIDGGAVRVVTDIPAGIVRVLFRPLPYEASNAQMVVSSLEGLMLLGLMLWRLPRMYTNLRLVRGSPYLVFCLVYSSLFIWAWSSIANLGIMARQRSLVLPFLLALIAVLGWDSRDSTAQRTDPDSEASEGRSVATSG